MRTLDDVVRQGKVRYIGLSNYMPWQAATAVMLQERMGIGEVRYGTDVLQPRRPRPRIRVSSRSPSTTTSVSFIGAELAGSFPFQASTAAPTLLLPAHASLRQVTFVPFDREMGYRVADTLKQVAARHDVSPARAALSWVLGRPAVSSVIVAARKAEQLEDNVAAVDLRLSDEDVRHLDAASDPGVPYPKWMVLQLDTAEDPRSRSCIRSAMRMAVPGRISGGRAGLAQRFAAGREGSQQNDIKGYVSICNCDNKRGRNSLGIGQRTV